MPRNDKKFLSFYNKLASLAYENRWSETTSNKYINLVLKHSSKAMSGKQGLPDLMYVNEKEKILILVELKSTINQHKKETIPEIKHYLNCFTEAYLGEIITLTKEIKDALKILSKWNILGIAGSGDAFISTGHLIDTFHLTIDKIEDLQINELLDESQYRNLFKNKNLEAISERITDSAIKINNLLYDVKEEKRPTLLSILMISLFEPKSFINHFRDDFYKYDSRKLFEMIKINIQEILGEKGEKLPTNKIDMITSEIDVLKRERVLIDTDIIKTILYLLRDNVIPLFNYKSNYDIIGKFYQEFLRYAGVVDVQSGIILTPEHITELFTELVDIKANDIIFDSCCGTGSFLIAAMNKLITLQSNKDSREHVKQLQIIGNEYRMHMYILAISNMLFRGDGKSNLLNYDFFSSDFDKNFSKIIKNIGKPTIGFINPPYSGSFTDFQELDGFRIKPDSKNKKPWMKEISFIQKMLTICSRYVVVITTPQSLMSEEELRNMILKDHTLKAVINMPKDLFEPNASTGSSIVVFETNRAHDFNKSVLFYNLKDDGYVLTKRKGRRDVYNQWNSIKVSLLKDIDAPYYRNPKNVDEITLIANKIKKNDEWVIQAHSKIDYSKLKKEFYEKSVKEKILFDAKKNFNFIAKDIELVDLIDLFINIDSKPVNNELISPKNANFSFFDIKDIFEIHHGERIAKKKRILGDMPLITAGKYDNGIKEYISNNLDKIEYENCFHFDMFGNVFYDDFKFVCDDNIYPLKLLDLHKNHIDKYNAIFLLSVLKHMTKYKFDYTRQLREKRINNDSNIKLSLPITKKGSINWKFMSDFIKSLKYSSAL